MLSPTTLYGSTEAIVFAAISFIVFGFASYMLLPKAAHTMLISKYQKLHKWWYESCDKYADKRANDSDYAPSSTDPGTDGALAIWLDDTQRSIRKDLLSHERYEYAVNKGLLEAPSEWPNLSESDIENKYCRSIPLAAKLVAAMIMGCLGGLCAYVNPIAFAFTPFLLVLWVLALCDQTSHILPSELCYVEYILALVPVALPMLSPDWLPAVYGIAAVLGVLVLGNIIFTFIGKPGAIGRGDMRLLPACALVLGATSYGFYAVCAMSFSMFAAVIVLKIARHGNFGMNDTVPMGMYIAFGVTTGIILSII